MKAPEFVQSSVLTSNSGFFKLEWRITDELPLQEGYSFLLEQSNDENFNHIKSIYKGSDLATYISGLPNGTFYYRVKIIEQQNQKESQWSPHLQARVEHFSLQFALTLCALGALVFLLTVAVIVIGVRSKNHS